MVISGIPLSTDCRQQTSSNCLRQIYQLNRNAKLQTQQIWLRDTAPFGTISRGNPIAYNEPFFWHVFWYETTCPRRLFLKRSNQSMDRLQGIVMQATLIHYLGSGVEYCCHEWTTQTGWAGDMDRLFLGVMIETWVPLDLMIELHINWQKVTSITSLHNGAARSKESSSNIFVYKW